MSYKPNWTLDELVDESFAIFMDHMHEGKGVREAIKQVTLRTLHSGVKHGRELARACVIENLQNNGQPDTADRMRKLSM